MEQRIIQIPEAQGGGRIDALCATLWPELSREYIKKIIKDGGVTLDGKTVKPGTKAAPGMTVVLNLPDLTPCEIRPQNIPLDIVYEDADVLVVNKPKGMVVHPAPGNPDGTLVNALMYHTSDLSGINGVERPGIVHRIDKDTSGLLMVAKNDLAHRSLTDQLKAHTNLRQYHALVIGRIRDNSGTIDMPVGRHPTQRIKMAVVPEDKGGRRAVTHYKVVQAYKGYTEMTFRLETGRTHQIRVHMAATGHPLVGDPLYHGDKSHSFKTRGQCLHAEMLGFVHPRTGADMCFTAPLPEDFQKMLQIIDQ